MCTHIPINSFHIQDPGSICIIYDLDLKMHEKLKKHQTLNKCKDLYFSLTREVTLYNKKFHTYMYYKPTPFTPQQILHS